MTIILSPDTQKLLEEQMTTGSYRSPDELVRAAIDALNNVTVESLNEAALAAIDESEDQIEAGKMHDWDDVKKRLQSQYPEKK